MQRVSDWLAWNAGEISSSGAHAWLVADADTAARLDVLDTPRWLTVVRAEYDFSAERPFCLSWTSNLGIRAAIEAGCVAILKTDPDIWFAGALQPMLDSIGERRGVCPTYMMCSSYEQARAHMEQSVPWNQTRGTLGLPVGAWASMRGYDERMVGYGVEDGDAYRRACAYADVARSFMVCHIAHAAGPQHRRARRDHWGRDDINPAMHGHNMARQTPWAPSVWGDPGGPSQA
jgi:hypothetical protein